MVARDHGSGLAGPVSATKPPLRIVPADDAADLVETGADEHDDELEHDLDALAQEEAFSCPTQKGQFEAPAKATALKGSASA